MKYIVYERDVCLIVCLKENYIRDVDYYILRPLSDKSLKISVPVNSKLLRSVISYDDALKLIDNIKDIDILDSDRLTYNDYKKLLDSGDLNDLVKIIKTTYLRNKERIDNKKKISAIDDEFFNKAESYLYTELGISLNMNFDDVREYIIDYLSK